MRLLLPIRLLCAGTLILGLSNLAIAHPHGGSDDMNMDIGVSAMPASHISPQHNTTMIYEPETYFQYGAHSGLLMAHILIMTVSWVFILPIGVMLSIAHSRYTLVVQLGFLAANALGVILVTIYNASTPDFYPNNAHHKLGWILTWVVGSQVLMGLIIAYANKLKGLETTKFTPISAEAMEEHHRVQNINLQRRHDRYRYSNDSGQGTEPNTESLRSQSISSLNLDHLPNLREECGEENEGEKSGLMGGSKVDKFLASKVPRLLSSKAIRILQIVYNTVDRLILILGFVALTSGIVTYGGFFEGSRIFSGLAHFIKGGIFFWYGILTLGRWSGCFSDIGWAWNINPLEKKNQLTAELVESFLIFFYGASNLFLEHLAAWGSAWTAQDLEHLSITIMFFGGGLCGMFIESKRIRGLLNASRGITRGSSQGALNTEEPKSYNFPMNPIPALILFLLGLMMSSHHQSSMISTMIHKQWGNLLIGASFARGATYIIFYLSPPSSILPGRPPTELITAFCLMAGGGIFMASARDTVAAMESNGLEAMFLFTVAMGVIMFLMAWIIFVIAIKGWAARKEMRSRSVYSVVGV